MAVLAAFAWAYPHRCPGAGRRVLTASSALPKAPTARILAPLAFMLGASPLAAANFSKVTIPELPGLASMASGSLAWADYDNDSRLDFLVTGSTLAQLWRNTGAGFTRVSVPGLPGVGEGAVAWGDYNNDGRLDFIICGMNGNGTPICQLWRNTGTGFVQTSVPGLPGVWLGDVAWGDFDNDGRLDFLLTGTRSFANGPRLTQLWRNTGQGFNQIPIPGLVGLESSSVAWGDYDNDGLLDFLVMGTTNGMFASGGPSSGEAAVTQLWRNLGGGFAPVEIAGLPQCYGGNLAWGDCDNDGRLDFLITGESASGKRTQVWRNIGDGFAEVIIPDFAGNFGGTAEWADYDNDGWLDFVVSGGDGAAATQLWRNTGGNFQWDPAIGLTQIGVPSVAWGDYNGDGRVDFLITGFDGNQEPPNQYFAELWRGAGAAINSPPLAPAGLSVATAAGVTTIQWLPATDDHTPAGGLSYNLRVGTRPGAADIVSPQAELSTGFRRLAAAGNAGARTQADLRLPPGTYFVSVQAVDSAWAGGPFSAEIAFSTLPSLRIERRGDQLAVLWSAPDPDYVLESSATLEPGSWEPVPLASGSPFLFGADQAPRFFRLRKP